MPTIKAYHGSDHIIEKFIHFQKEFTNDQYGPGIYFTNKESVARGYGKYLYEVKINTKGFITSSSDYDESKLLKIITDNLTADLLLDWGDTQKTARSNIINQTLDEESYYDTLMNIWANVFRLNNKKYLDACVKAGINGLIKGMTIGTKYYIVYNTENIK